MSDPYLYYNLIKDTSVCGHLDFNCLKLKYEVNHDILLFILALAIQYPLERYLDLPERLELPERPLKDRKDQRIIIDWYFGENFY